MLESELHSRRVIILSGPKDRQLTIWQQALFINVSHHLYALISSLFWPRNDCWLSHCILCWLISIMQWFQSQQSRTGTVWQTNEACAMLLATYRCVCYYGWVLRKITCIVSKSHHVMKVNSLQSGQEWMMPCRVPHNTWCSFSQCEYFILIIRVW
jgi:hypothetical protein